MTNNHLSLLIIMLSRTIHNREQKCTVSKLSMSNLYIAPLVFTELYYMVGN